MQEGAVARKTKSRKWMVTIIFAMLLCCCVFVVSTYALLSDSRTVTGSVTFNLADYKLYMTNTSNFSGQIAPGYNGTTKNVELVNSYASSSMFGTPTGGATTEAMSAVYIKLTDIAVKVGTTNVALSSFSKNADGVQIATKGGMTFTLLSSAGVGSWFYSGQDIYLSSSATSLSKSSLAFSKNNSNKQVANIQFKVNVSDPGTQGGFNATTAGSNVIDNDFQGKDISISYTVKWATDVETLG